jgi:hypothetical protein
LKELPISFQILPFSSWKKSGLVAKLLYFMIAQK